LHLGDSARKTTDQTAFARAETPTSKKAFVIEPLRVIRAFGLPRLSWDKLKWQIVLPIYIKLLHEFVNVFHGSRWLNPRHKRGRLDEQVAAATCLLTASATVSEGFFPLWHPELTLPKLGQTENLPKKTGQIPGRSLVPQKVFPQNRELSAGEWDPSCDQIASY